MSTARTILNRMIDQLPEDVLVDVIMQISIIQKIKKEAIFKEIEEASVSSMEFWDNTIDDEVWNNV